MANSSHPLVEPRAGAALALAGVCAGGWSLMVSPFVWMGFAVSFFGAVATLWLYTSEFATLGDLFKTHGFAINKYPKEIIVAAMIIGLDIIVTGYLLFSMTTSGETRSFTYIVLCVACAFVGFLYGFGARTTRKSGRRDKVFMGSAFVNATALAKDLVLTLEMRCFNGSDDSLAIVGLNGHIDAGWAPTTGGTGGEIGALPSPVLKQAVPSSVGIASCSEFSVLIEQRVTREQADAIENIVDGINNLHLRLSKMDVILSFEAGDSHFSMKKWDGVSVDGLSKPALCNRMIELRASIGGG